MVRIATTHRSHPCNPVVDFHLTGIVTAEIISAMGRNLKSFVDILTSSLI